MSSSFASWHVMKEVSFRSQPDLLKCQLAGSLWIFCDDECIVSDNQVEKVVIIFTISTVVPMKPNLTIGILSCHYHVSP